MKKNLITTAMIVLNFSAFAQFENEFAASNWVVYGAGDMNYALMPDVLILNGAGDGKTSASIIAKRSGTLSFFAARTDDDYQTKFTFGNNVISIHSPDTFHAEIKAGQKIEFSIIGTGVFHVSDFKFVAKVEPTPQTPTSCGAKIYPNPTFGDVNIEFGCNAHGRFLSLFDASGKLIDEYFFSSTIGKISISRLPAGVYFIAITNQMESNENQLLKIVKL